MKRMMDGYMEANDIPSWTTIHRRNKRSEFCAATIEGKDI
jgi:hypothetical protein